ncbi:MAG: DNA primase, partial [Sediminibacterium sp.]|nr:DNA primase [Sediminibacterium sp.]
MISPNTIQQIIQRIDIIDVLGEFIQLKKRGVNFIGRCPFHNEKTPSFTVSPSKEIYKCFGCGKSGNTIQFIMEHEKYSYVETIRWLANRYKIEIEETNSNPAYFLQQQEKDSLFIINEFAKNFFIEQLWQTEQGKKMALPYLKYRNFLDSTIEKFQLGFASNQWNTLYNSFVKNQYNIDLVKKTGLISQKEDTNYYDTYRERIIFPIHNITGKVIGFGARIIGKNDKTAKYINTPENELYSKSNILYGMYYAKTTIQQQDECILVEGYTDVISLHQAGIENVVASGGTALTINQLRLIKKYTKNLTIIYDGDKAGIKAALRGLDIALTEGLNVHLLLIPNQEDPDSFVYNVGATAFKEFIQKEKKDFLIFQIDIQLSDIGNDINKKNELVN